MKITLPVIALEEQFASPVREIQWRAFLRRHRLTVPATLRETIRALSAFLYPLMRSLAEGREYLQHWAPGGPWR